MQIRPVVKCRLLELIQHPGNKYTAVIERLSVHPVLGEPRGSMSHTSEVCLIMFDTKIMVTRNTIYDFS